MGRLLLLIILLMSPAAVLGQTVLPDPPVKPGEGRPAAPDAGGGTAGLAAGTIDFPDLHQPGRISAETATIQRAWDDAPGEAGIAEYRLCGSCVYRVRTRELMVTTVVLPADVRIEQVDLGDPVGFEIQTRGGNMVVVRPRAFGIDSNMNVYTDKGVMSFYLRAEGFDSDHVPDLVVRITAGGPLPESTIERPDPRKAPPRAPTGSLLKPVDPAELTRQSGAKTGDISFDPAKLRGWGDYSLRGAESLRPETVFRDDHFTYIHFGDRWTDIELPVAFVVIDGIDETVNTRVQGQTLIVESTSRKISLKSGESYLCIEYSGGQA